MCLYKRVSLQPALLLISFSISQLSCPFRVAFLHWQTCTLWLVEMAAPSSKFCLCRLTCRASINFSFLPQHPCKSSKEGHRLALLGHVPGILWSMPGVCAHSVSRVRDCYQKERGRNHTGLSEAITVTGQHYVQLFDSILYPLLWVLHIEKWLSFL